MTRKTISWGIIVLWFFLFFPVAIYLIIKKMTVEKFNYIRNGKSLKTLGFVLASFSLIYLIMPFTLDVQNADVSTPAIGLLIPSILFGCLAVLCFLKGKSYVKLGSKYNRYISIISSNSNLSVDNIASIVLTTYDKAIVDIQSILDAGLLPNAYLDLNRRQLVMPRSEVRTTVTATNYVYNEVNPENNMPRSVKCQNCGATITITPNAKNECEYCGSTI